jgi:hypothetical protein
MPLGRLTTVDCKIFDPVHAYIPIQVSQKWRTNYLLPYRECLNVHEKNMEKMFPTKKLIIFIRRYPTSTGGTAILPEYIHYYGYYYQVIVQCLST